MPHINYKRGESRTFVVRHEPYCTVSGRLRYYKHRHDSLESYRTHRARHLRRVVKEWLERGDFDGEPMPRQKKDVFWNAY